MLGVGVAIEDGAADNATGIEDGVADGEAIAKTALPCFAGRCRSLPQAQTSYHWALIRHGRSFHG